MVFPFFILPTHTAHGGAKCWGDAKKKETVLPFFPYFSSFPFPLFHHIFPPLTMNTALITQASSLPLSFLSHFIPYSPTFILTPPLSSETQLRKAKGRVQGRHALNHIYKDLVSIVITQSTDKGCVMGEGVCVRERSCRLKCAHLRISLWKEEEGYYF